MIKFKCLLANIGGCFLLGSVVDMPIFSRNWFIVILAAVMFNAAGGYFISDY